MAGNPFINSIAKQNRQGDPRFGRFGAGGSSSQGQYQAQPNYSSEPQQYGQQTYGGMVSRSKRTMTSTSRRSTIRMHNPAMLPLPRATASP